MSQETECHLCVTHSALVTRVFAAAARELGLPEDSLRYISRRGTRIPEPGTCFDDISDEMDRCLKRFDRGGFRLVRRRFEEALGRLTGGRPFEAYLPHGNKILYQEIIGHRSCAGYSFLEEGFTSMAWNTWRNDRSSRAKILRSAARCVWVRTNYRFTRPMFDHSRPHYRAAFALSGAAFQGMPGRIDVAAGLPPLRPGKPPGSVYLLLDMSYRHSGRSWEDYANSMARAVRLHSLADADVRIKFHPSDSDVSRKFESLRRRLADQGFSRVSLLGPEFQTEEELTASDLLVFGTSSVGYYAAIQGVRVACFADETEIAFIASLIGRGKLPKDFREVVGLPPVESPIRLAGARRPVARSDHEPAG